MIKVKKIAVILLTIGIVATLAIPGFAASEKYRKSNYYVPSENKTYAYTYYKHSSKRHWARVQCGWSTLTSTAPAGCGAQVEARVGGRWNSSHSRGVN